MDTKVVEAVRYWNLLNRKIHLKHHETAQKYNLTLEQFHLLIELNELELDIPENQSPTVGEIANRSGNAPHTLSERINRLEKRGLVIKIKDKRDLRVSRVVLTVKGRDLVNTIRTESKNIFLYSALEKMDEKSIDCLMECLKKISEELD